MKKFLRAASIVVVVGFALDAVLTWFWPHLLVGVGGAVHKGAGPFGTAVVAAIYFCRDMFVDSKASQIQQVELKVEPKLEQKFEPKIEIKNDFSEFAKAMAEAQEMMATNKDDGERSAQRYFVVDADGNRRGMFGVTDQGTAMLSMFNSNQKPVFIVTEVGDQSVILLADGQGNLKAYIAARPADARLILFDSSGTERLSANVTPQSSLIDLRGEGEEPRLLSLSLLPDAGPVIAFKGLGTSGVFVSDEGLFGRDANGKYFGLGEPQASDETKG